MVKVGGVAEGLADGETLGDGDALGEAVGEGETVAVGDALGVGVCATAVAESTAKTARVRSAGALREKTDRVILVFESWKSGRAHAGEFQFVAVSLNRRVFIQ